MRARDPERSEGRKTIPLTNAKSDSNRLDRPTSDSITAPGRRARERERERERERQRDRERKTERERQRERERERKRERKRER